ncbi:MAG: hypothetical protein KZQ83_07985 [gamma proteobacterium symbiont of Taylorina sp.]|nr:hypothetical protein [gamma proteobacterium symbiont of Taylorina sp.]
MSHNPAAYVNSSILVLSLSLFTISCSKHESDDSQTLHFTTADGIKTTLDIDNEIYRVDDHSGIYYINFRYYKKNIQNQWMFSAKLDNSWKVYLDQGAIPRSLHLLTLSQKQDNINTKQQK